MPDSIYALILAGGSGERFWPLSRRARPKQLLRLVSDKTLLEETLARLDGLIPRERSRFCAGAISGGTPGCLFGPCRPSSESSIATRPSWLISFRNYGRREISTTHCASGTPDCRGSPSITRSWKKRTAFLSSRLVLIGTT